MAAATGAATAGVRVGFLGLGIMGRGMAANLVKAGFQVTVWNRTASRCDSFVSSGATMAATPAEVMEGCDLTFACVSDPAAAEELAFGPNGVLSATKAAAGSGYIDCSTIDAGTSAKIAAAVTGKGWRYLEAPVSGSKGPAEQGTLIFLAAGDKSLFTQATPCLDAMGKMNCYLGETIGGGARMKLAVNCVMGTLTTALAEGVCLAEKSGLPVDEFLRVLDNGAMSNPVFRAKGPCMAKGEYPANFPLKHQEKDLRLAMELAAEVGAVMPVSAAARATYGEAQAMGGGELGDGDMGGVYEAVKKASSQ